MTKLYLEVNGPKRSCKFTALYMCVFIVREKYINSLFTNVHKVQHCTGYPLIQVEIVSICKSHYMHWLVSQSSLLTFLFLECVVTHGLSPVWVQVQVQVQVQILLLQVHPLQFLHFLPFFLKNTKLDTGEVFGVVMKTRLGEILSTELCQTKFLSSL